MASNPRKFSEKIALLHQKQAEETAAFEKIMREVSDATSKNDEISLTQFGLGAADATTLMDGNFKGGGSGDISNNSADLIGDDSGGQVKSNSTSFSHSSNNLSGSPNINNNNNSNNSSSSQATSHHVSRVRNVGVGPMRRPADRKIDTSPYGNNVAYLSPPSDTSWRRTSSDSAIHQSLNQNQDHHHSYHHHHHHQYTSQSPLTLSPTSQRKIAMGMNNQQAQQHQQAGQPQSLVGGIMQGSRSAQNSSNLIHLIENSTNSSNNNNNTNNSNSKMPFHLGHSQSNQQLNYIVGDGSSGGVGIIDNNRPRSSCGRLPGINIHPSAHDNTIQIPISNNTGSLPDLTSVHFPSPLHTPIDQEHDHSSSPYSSSPITASPTTLSPTSMPVRHPGARFHYSPTNSPGDGSTGANNASFSPTNQQSTISQQFLSVPGRYSHFNKTGSTGMDGTSYQTQHSPQGSQSGESQLQQQHATYNVNCQPNQQPTFQQQQQLISNTIHGSHGNLSNIQVNLSGYRSPQCRPSPGSSPNLIGALASCGDSTNPSAPCSPSPSQTSPGNNGQSGYGDQYGTAANDVYFVNQQNIQQHFESFSLVDNPEFVQPPTQNAQSFSQFENGNFTSFNQSNHSTSQPESITNAQASSATNLKSLLANPMITSIQQQQQQQQQQGQGQTNSNGLGQLNLTLQQQQQQHQQQGPLVSSSLQTPNTPTSIPEIVFTDFSSSAGSEFTKDMFGETLMPLDLELGPMDMAGFQMLANPNATMIADPTDEDSFRQDLH